MGIKNFFKIKITNTKSDFNNKVIAEFGEPTMLKKLKGSKICIDASGQIYNSILALESIKALTDKDGNSTGHINTIFNKIIQFDEAGIIQLWIFDSPTPNKMKEREYQRRAKRRETAKADDTKIQYRLTSVHVNEIQTLLKRMGKMYMVAPEGIEAEQLGAFLTRGSEDQRFCKYMLSEDSDVLFFGGNLLRSTKQKSASGKTTKTIYQTYELDDLLYELDLGYEEFLKMGVAMGTDFNDANEENYGPVKIVAGIKQDKVYITPAMKDAMLYYKSPVGDKITQIEKVKEEYNRSGVEEFLKSKNFNSERIKDRLDAYDRTKG